MKIALVGYGKMGQIIDELATNKGHQIVAKLNDTPTISSLNNAEVVIEFSNPEVAFENIKFCLEQKIPVVCGTTGWLSTKPDIEKIALEYKTAFLYGSNFSLGVNLFFELNKKLAEMMAKFPEYNCQLEEIHHTHKLDAPSGTAISLAEDIIKNNSTFTNWKLEETENATLGIHALRKDEVPGTHSVFYKSEVDEIEIKHTAFSRNGFAMGAILAAEWIVGKSGVFSMKDVLGFD